MKIGTKGFIWRTLLVVAGLVATLSIASLAFKITPELQKEVLEKQKAVASCPASAEARFDLAITYAYSNYVKEGWDELRKVPDLDKNFPAYALKKYGELAASNPQDWKIAYRHAFALYFNGKKMDAYNEFGRVLKLEPGNALAYGYRSLILGEMGKVNDAIVEVKKGLAIDQQIAALHLLLADGYLKTGKSWEGFWEGVEASRLKSLGF
jgi:tetratricopeptide (TPR) repeat protein